MRLTHIRLAGFKSFVEPTAFAVPSQLVGVVGPNGCGKSNIIDAVRWVLGESKASELRGESMQDVIFNGSTQRKAAARASVELVFDNNQARAGGSWNQYSEIAVKRVLTRDGVSTYYINQQAVRRRDVQDIFMGTGLGPRAYAIIGQGMIARIIEARPEELRVFLEEAAGVSKYKERRRETGNRLQDTHDNLTRVEDIRRELGGQIERLEQQATVARQYKALDEERSTKQRWLWALRLHDARQQKNQHSADLERAKANLEQLHSQSVHTQTTLFGLRQRQQEAQQALEREQTQWVEASREVGRLEGDLRVMAEARSRLAARVQELLLEASRWQDRQEQAQAKQGQLQAQAQDHAMVLEEQRVVLEEAELQCDPLHEAVHNARAQQDTQRVQVMDLQRQLAQVASQQEAASRADLQLQLKLERLRSEAQALQVPSPQALQHSATHLAHIQAELHTAQQQHAQAEAQLQSLQQQFDQAQDVFQRERDRHAQVAAQLAALEHLHQQVGEEGAMGPWLEEQGLHQSRRLLADVQVERGWERAVETALREVLDAVQVGDLNTVTGFLQKPPPARLGFVDTLAASASLPLPSIGQNDLASVVRCAQPAAQAVVVRLLAGCLMAPDLNAALKLRASLQPQQKLFTPQGHWLTAHSVALYAADSPQAGRLERMQTMEALRTELRALELLKQSSMAQRDQLQVQLGAAKTTVGEARKAVEALTRQGHEAELAHMRLEEQQHRADARKQQLDSDQASLRAEQEEQRETLASCEERCAALDERLALASNHLEALKDTLAQAEQALRSQQQRCQDLQRQLQQAEFEARNHSNQAAELERERSMAVQQLQQIQSRQQQAEQELLGLSETSIQDALQAALEQRVVAEEQVAMARDALEQCMGQVSTLERQEKDSDRQAEPLRQAIQDLALKLQAAELAMAQHQSSLQEASADPDAMVQAVLALEPVPKPSVLQGEVTRLGQAIAELGAVNLAALDELAAASDRKTFLDQQAGDLLEAISTLEDAIRTIDKETRDLLGETFAAVNGHFSRLFPQLFGGGEARLVMTGDEILDAGVQVFAQPPGKKNGTIHLLSGGEKALTATALVFAIFELNPAPFCLLDEVDAPLDDANTERFCRLVQKMAEQTQFLFISHNKIAMEMAQQLIGVTMQEKGVSRIVAVDLAAAKQMASETV